MVRIALGATLTLDLSPSHACAALSYLKPPSFCKGKKSINNRVGHVKKASCKLRPCIPGQSRALLTQKLTEMHDSKSSHLFAANIFFTKFGIISTPAEQRRTARTHLLHPPPTDSPPIYIKFCLFLC
ncbi:MAG: hypothetical protein WBB23_14900 [Desulforhopalus sp.]